ncbi:hypothetical protein Tco_1437154 [Tanacetum coccineum]
MGQSGVGNSYVQVVKGNNTSVVAESDHTPTLVLDDECLNTSDLSNSLMGRVKEFASLSNLKMVLHKEGFNNIKIQYMGELWVLVEFDSEASKTFPMLIMTVKWTKVLETCFEGANRRITTNHEELSTGQKENHSMIHTSIYELLNKKKDNVESEDKSGTHSTYPRLYSKGWYELSRRSMEKWESGEASLKSAFPSYRMDISANEIII